MKSLICISGLRGSGKSLLASYLEHYHGWTRFSLAEELKKECLRDWKKLTPAHLWGKDKEVPTGYFRRQGQPLTGRDIMIRHGEYRRSINENYWCEKFDPSVGDKIVVDDLRFKNEVEFFRKHGARFVRIERKPELNVYGAALDTQSETELNENVVWDVILPAERNVNAEDLRRFAEELNRSL